MQRSRVRFALATLMLGTTLIVAGCGSTLSSSDNSFSVVLPSGWSSGSESGSSADVHDLLDASSGSATATVSMASQYGPIDPSPGSVLGMAYAHIEAGGPTSITPLVRDKFNGEPALSFVLTFANNGGQMITAKSYWIDHNGRTYAVLVGAPSSEYAKRQSEFASLIDSWRWN